MGVKKARGYRFVTYTGDHPPLHVHIYRGRREIGRWDIENQRPMDNFSLSRNLGKALAETGYLLEVAEDDDST